MSSENQDKPANESEKPKFVLDHQRVIETNERMKKQLIKLTISIETMQKEVEALNNKYKPKQ